MPNVKLIFQHVNQMEPHVLMSPQILAQVLQAFPLFVRGSLILMVSVLVLMLQLRLPQEPALIKHVPKM